MATYPHELIGQMIEIVHASNKQLEGLQGKIVDETKSTIALEHAGKTKILLKKAITFRLRASGRVLKGNELIRKPEERIKGN